MKWGLHQYGVWAVDDCIVGDFDDKGYEPLSDGLLVEKTFDILERDVWYQFLWLRREEALVSSGGALFELMLTDGSRVHILTTPEVVLWVTGFTVVVLVVVEVVVERTDGGDTDTSQIKR